MKGSPVGGANSAQKPPVPGNQRIWSSPPLDATATEFTPSAAAPAQNYTQPSVAAPAQNYTQPSAAAPAQYYTQQPVPPARRPRLWPSGPRTLPSLSYTEVFFPLPSAVPAHYMQLINHEGSGLYVARDFGPTLIDRPLETHADVQRRMQDRTDEMERRRAAGWVPRELPLSFENVLDRSGTRPSQLNASAPSFEYAPAQIPAPNVLQQPVTYPGTHPSQLNASAPSYEYAPVQTLAPAPQFTSSTTSTNVLHNSGTHPSRLNASAPPFNAPTLLAPVLDDEEVKQQELRDWLEDKGVKPQLIDLVLTRFSSLDYLLDHGNGDLLRMLPELSSMRHEARLLFVARIKDERTVRGTKLHSGNKGYVMEIRSKGSQTWTRYASAAKAAKYYFDDATLADLKKDSSAMNDAIRKCFQENQRPPKWFTKKYDVRKVNDPPVERNGLLFSCTSGSSKSNEECPFGPQGPEAFAPIDKGRRFCVISLLQRRRAASSARSVGAPRCKPSSRSRRRRRLDAMPRRSGTVCAAEKERGRESLRDS